MQVCTLLQTDNHASTPLLSFLQAGCPFCHPTNNVKALKAFWSVNKQRKGTFNYHASEVSKVKQFQSGALEVEHNSLNYSFIFVDPRKGP